MSSAIVPITNSKEYFGFDPRGIASCVLWLDGADRTTIFQDTAGTTIVTANNDPVNRWKDKSVRANDAISTGTPMRYLSSGGISNNTINTVFTLDVTKLTSGTTPISTFIVFQPFPRPSDANNQMMLTWGTRNSNQAPQYFLSQTASGASGANRIIINTFAIGTINDNINLVAGANNLLSSVIDSLNVNGWRNGTAFSSNNGGSSLNVGNTFAFLGAQIDTPLTLPFGGHFREIIIYNVGLTTTLRQQVEGYLAQKWGLTSNMLFRHPYTAVPLYIRPFTPVDTGVCTFWIDATDASTVTINGSGIVTGVRDKSGNAFNITNTMTTNGFVWNGSTKFNLNYPSFFYNGALQNITLGSRSTTPAFGSATGVFTVQQVVGTASTQDIFDSTGGTRLFGFYFIPSPGSQNYRIFNGTTLVPAGTATTNPAIYSHVFTGSTTTAAIFENGRQTVVGNAGSGGGTGIVIGSRQTLNQETFQGHIAEVIYYGTSAIPVNLTTSTNLNIRYQTEGYLAWKWGLQGSQYPPNLDFSFTPTQISGCQLWLDAADSSTLTLSGLNVTQWNDKSGNGYNCTVSSGANSPTFVSTARMVTFRSASLQSLTIAQGLGNALVNVTNYTIFFVGARRATGFQYFLSGAVGTFRQNLLLGFNTATSAQYSMYGDDFQATVPSFVTNDPTYTYILSFSSATNYRDIVINGTVGATSALSGLLSAFSTPMLGRRYLASPDLTYHNFDLNEMIVYTGALTLSQRQQIEGYLAWKWNISENLPTTHPYASPGLPATHPFKLCPPMVVQFNPLAISNCQLWLDAADTSTITRGSGSFVSGWSNKGLGGLSAFTINVAGGQGTTGNIINGLNYINFSSVFSFTGQISPTATTTRSYFIVKRSNRELSNGETYNIMRPSSSVAFGAICETLSSTSSTIFTDSQFGSIRNNTQPNPNGRFLMYSMTVNATSTASNVIAINGNVQTLSTNSTFTMSTGSTTFSCNYTSLGVVINTDFMEFIIYDTILTTFQRQQMEGYLAWKWGLQNSLPVTHPYAKFSP